MAADRLLVAAARRPELAFVDRAGRVLEQIDAVGYPRFPTARPGGGVAYLAITDADDPWQVVLVVLDELMTLVDVIPGAAVHAPPVWSTDGERLLFVRGEGARASIVELTLDDGSESVRFEGEHVRSAAWGADGLLIRSSGGGIYRAGEAEPFAQIVAAPGFQEYGSDDLYVTIDQLTIGPDGTVAAVERWYRQGQAPRDHVVTVAADGGISRLSAGRAPVWDHYGGLTYTSDDGAVRVANGPAITFPGGIHSACWAPGR